MDNRSKLLCALNLCPVPALAKDMQQRIFELFDQLHKGRERDDAVFASMHEESLMANFLEIDLKLRHGLHIILTREREHGGNFR